MNNQQNEHSSSLAQTASGKKPDSAPQSTGLPEPWNPKVLFWLGFIFSSIWLAIMTYINSRRLKNPVNGWHLTGLVAAEIGIDMFARVFVWDSFFMSLAISGTIIFLFWKLYLQNQLELFESGNAKETSSQWILPAICGSPLALLVVTSAVMDFAGPSPREVCEAFTYEDSAGMRDYVTANMLPLIGQIERLEKLDSDTGAVGETTCQFELTYEVDSPELGGYIVGNNMYIQYDDNSSYLMNGFFHLVDYGEGWKIDGWYQEAENGVMLQQGAASMIDFWRQLAETAEANSAAMLTANEETDQPPENAPKFKIIPPGDFVKWASYHYGPVGTAIAIILVFAVLSYIGRNLR